MKKTIIISMLLLATGSLSVMAQGGGFQQRTPEERLQQVHFKIDSAFKLDAAIMSKVDSVFLASYAETDKMREAFRNSGSQDFQTMREKMQPIIDARDAKLKPLLGDDNFKTWKEQIDPSMRRGPGGGGRGNN